MQFLTAMKQYGFLALLPLLTSGVSAAEALHYPDLKIQVTLSPAARKALVEGKEEIVAYASWYGWPKAKWKSAADRTGQIDLGHQTLPVAVQDGGVTFSLTKIPDAKKIGWLKDGLYINVNIFSNRQHWPDNILGCDIVDGPLIEVASHPVEIKCALLTEKNLSRAIVR